MAPTCVRLVPLKPKSIVTTAPLGSLGTTGAAAVVVPCVMTSGSYTDSAPVAGFRMVACTKAPRFAELASVQPDASGVWPPGPVSRYGVASPAALSGCAGTMISQSAFAAGAGAAEAGANAPAVGAGAVAVADGQGVIVADVARADIVVEDPAGGAAAGVTVAAGPGAVEAPPATADVAPAAAEAGSGQGFAGAAALTEASSTVRMCGVMTAAIPTPSTTARRQIINAGRARGGRSWWLRSRRSARR